MTTKDDDMQMVVEACEKLGEHFDTVQIFVSHHQGGMDGTMAIAYGCGNSFARYAQASLWCKAEEKNHVMNMRE